MAKATPKPIQINFEKIFQLAERLPFFDTLSSHQIIKVLKQLEGEVFVYKEGDLIIEEKAKDHELFIILSGSVTVHKGEEQFTAIGIVKAGDFFGEISFIMGSARTASVSANEETIVLRLSQEKFDSLEIIIQSQVKDKILRKLVARLDIMNRAVLKLLEEEE